MSIEDRSWMYQGWHADGRHSEEWARNTTAFVDRAFSVGPNSEKSGVVCPCSDCCNRVRRRRGVMTMHLCKRGFMPGYTRWTEHGELPVSEPRMGHAYNTVDGLDEMLADFGDAMNDDSAEEEPPADAKAFYAMLSASQEPVHNFTSVAQLTAVARLMAIKSQHNLSAECINKLLGLFDDVLPENHKMPKTLYECKSLLSGLKMPYVKIDACVNNCMIYYGDDDKDKEKCDFCEESRYVVGEPTNQGRKRKPIARKVLRYLPVTARLQRLYMEPKTAKHMRWHKEGRRANPNVMVHPSDAEAWQHFSTVCPDPDFALDARNVRIAMATDGFNPFGYGKAQYSCWPVFVIPLNLPPSLFMKEENIFLSLVIPGPEHPGKNFNVFMRPLVDELKKAWGGVVTWDSFSKRRFNMRVSYHTSIHDFPALGMFSGWSTHGRLACPDCMADVDSAWLSKGRKFSWFDCHRRFLPPDHSFRDQQNAFRKGVVVHDPPPHRLTGAEVLAYMNEVKENNFDGYGTTHNWTHIPFLWELSYFPKLLRPHNIGVMHTEKNVSEAIFSTCLNIADKTKDNNKARLDQALMCNRKHLEEKPNDKWDRPRAPFCLSRPQKKVVMQWFMDIKFPDGYAANLRRGVNMDQLKINGLKSHDYHIFIERLLPVMMRGFVKSEIWEALAELSFFFRVLCAKEVDRAQILQLETNIPIILCKLEKIFPPGLFNPMEHLMVHLPYQVRVGGPIKYTWMYGVERLLKKVRAKVHNKARVEASIVEASLVEEITHITSLYLPELISSSRNCPQRYAQCGAPSSCSLSLFQVRGWKTGRGVSRFLTIEEYKTAMIYIYTNLTEMDEYVQKFEREQWRRARPPNQKQLDNLRMNGAGNGKPDLLDWFRTLCDMDARIPSELRRLSRGCGLKVKSYDIYEVNGYRFRSEKYEKYRGNLTTTNTGVLAVGDDGKNNELEYYGIIKDIIELKFDGDSDFSLVLFDCHWFHPTNGVRHLSRFGLVEVAHASSNPANEPFVLASQVKQVYYLPYACKSIPSLNEWWVAYKRVAEHTGMAITTVPSLLPPPPPPPIYAASPSPNPSPDNVGTFQSSVGMESPEETISRIANGVFRGHVNATTSGGGTYSPIANDDFPLYD